jgi:hypothetical protein
MTGDPPDIPDDEPNAFADASDVLREQDPEWEPPDPRDSEAMLAACTYWHDHYIEIADEQGQRDITRELRRFIVVTKALAWVAEVNGIDSAPLVAFFHDAESFYWKLEDRLPIATPEIHVLLERLKFKLESQQPPPPSPHATAPAAPAVMPPESPSPRVECPEIDESQFVRYWHGKRYEFTSGKPFEVLVYLVRKFNTWLVCRTLWTRCGENRLLVKTLSKRLSARYGKSYEVVGSPI